MVADVQLEEPSLKLRQKKTAVSRLMKLGVPDRIAREYDNFGRVYMCSSPSGLYSLIDDKGMLDEIAAFEENTQSAVYLVIRLHTLFGLLDSLIFVSRYDEEWADEEIDLADHYLMTYTLNRDEPAFSEYGSIYYQKTPNRGIVRVMG